MKRRKETRGFAQDAETHGNPIGWGMAPSDVREDYRKHVRAVLAAALAAPSDPPDHELGP